MVLCYFVTFLIRQLCVPGQAPWWQKPFPKFQPELEKFKKEWWFILNTHILYLEGKKKSDLLCSNDLRQHSFVFTFDSFWGISNQFLLLLEKAHEVIMFDLLELRFGNRISFKIHPISHPHRLIAPFFTELIVLPLEKGSFIPLLVSNTYSLVLILYFSQVALCNCCIFLPVADFIEIREMLRGTALDLAGCKLLFNWLFFRMSLVKKCLNPM